ncbi:MAG: decarboxylase, partial [Phascolarctobacterium sp.]|nr:decarboxylase [Phascolarctobacterium sp.]
VTEMVLPLREVFYGDKEAVALEESAGEICGEQVSFYPPGIPVLLPGEVITPEIINYCKMMKSLGLPVSGPADGSLKTIRVVRK